jgi:hypothetical protein
MDINIIPFPFQPANFSHILFGRPYFMIYCIAVLGLTEQDKEAKSAEDKRSHLDSV